MNKEDLKFIRETLFRHLDPSKNSAFIFGSRASGDNVGYSDYDIGIEGERLPARVFFELKSDFEESSFPYKVDIVDFNDVSEEFAKVARSSIINID